MKKNNFNLLQLILLVIIITSTSLLSKQTSEDEGVFSKLKLTIVNLGSSVNSISNEEAPIISPDGKRLYFCSNRIGSIENANSPTYDLWCASKKDRLSTIFEMAYNLDPKISQDKSNSNNLIELGLNTNKDELSGTMSADKGTIIFSSKNRHDGLGEEDLYKAKIEGDKFGKPINIIKLNSKHIDTHPSLSIDGKKIFFASTRPGPNSNGDNLNQENMDIWFSEYDYETDEWTIPKNIEEINSKQCDQTPFIAADNETLFFASNGWSPNFGGLDLYVSKYDPTTKKFSKPRNLGKVVNSKGDEKFITMPASGELFYFTSNRNDIPDYQGGMDIFMCFIKK